MRNETKQAARKALETLEALDESLKELKACKRKALRELLEDAVAKRFEVAFEYVWKAFKIASEEQGTEAPGPKPAIQAAFRYRWIAKGIERWQFFLEARNSGVHQYFGIPKREYLAAIRDFAVEAEEAVRRIQK